MTGDEASERNSHPEAPHQSMAVLFADITDSTKLYNTLGDAAARVVINGCLLAVADVAERYRGRVVKTIGDEALCIFRRADDAVLAASAMQPEVEARRPGNCAIQLHIGLQYGPVLLEEHDVYGDTVNVAAYLTALAAAEQILTTDATERYVSGPLKDNLRAVFKVQLKGSAEESTVYQVLLDKDLSGVTQVNLRWHNIRPGGQGALILWYANASVTVDDARPDISLGRGEDCDLVIRERLASRRHASIRLLRSHFYLVDHSLNGTFVVFESGEEVHVLHRELLLGSPGKLTLGCGIAHGAKEIITFTPDRRPVYAVGYG
jgi:adenylate cyclase